MRHLNKLLCACSFVALGLPALTGCEGGELFEVNAPDWISDKIQDIEDSENGNQEEIVLEGMMEDVYTIGNTDYSSAWWTAFSKYYVIPDGQKWNAVFNLKINPDAPKTYKNFVLVICADAERGGEGYKEYGAIRFDNQPSGNSEWGDYIDRSCIESTLTFETDTDEGIEKLGGKVTLVVDRTSPEAFNVIMTNGVVTKTYKQPTALVNLNADQTNTNIRCFLVAEGSYIDFLETNIVPIEGLTSAKDKNPKSMVLQNVPQYVDAETELEKIVANVTALVTFEEEVTKTVTASELSFSEVPDMNIPGTKTLVAAYNKTFKGENCDTPILANAKFEVVEKIKSIRVTKQPIHTTYTLGNTPLTGYTLAFDPTGLEVEGTDTQGKTRVLENSTLTFSGVPTEAGIQNVIVTYKEVTTTVPVQVLVSSAIEITNGSNMLGNEDNSSLWANPIYSDAFKVNAGETKYITFTNYSNLAENWNNFLVILRNKDNSQTVVRADNWGWGPGYENNAACIHYGTQGVWEDWLKGMNGAKVTVFVTNNGDGTADVLSTMEGTTGQKSTQYYYGLNNMDSDNLEFMLSVDGCHLVF